MTLSTGPLTILSGDSAIVAFALLGGEDLASLQASATAAQIKYYTLNAVFPVDAPMGGLSQNFPNPFTESTTINYAVTSANKVTIEIYDVLGAKVSTLVEGDLSPGYYSVPFSGTGISKGVYYCKMTSGDYSRVISLVKM